MIDIKKKISIFLFSSILITACTTTRPLAGIESSVNQMGDIQRVRITADQGMVRTGCSTDTPVLHTSDKDNTLDVVCPSPVENYYAVRCPNNAVGFIPKGECTPVVAEDQPTPAPSTQEQTPQGTAGQGATTPGTTAPGTTGQGAIVPETTDKTAQKTPTEKTNSGSLTADEQKMLNLINEARAQNNVPALKIDMSVTNVARIKAQDMIDNKYFSHNSPKYGSPFDMLKSFGIKYVQAGENIAGNQSVEAAHNSLMNSPGHRKNILSPDYTHIGIGIKKGGQYGNMFSQMFVSQPK